MREHIKTQLIELLITMQAIHREMWDNEEYKIRQECLELCREATVAIREALATSKRQQENQENIQELVTVYEDCVRQLLEQEIIQPDELEYIHALAVTMEEEAHKVLTTYHVVFFPYNASMWDSLESVYLSAKEDPNCECYVVPIPYYKCDTVNNKWIPCYEGEQFPSDIPITDYKAYHIEKTEPDIAYIHNPYDDANYVTRVEPKYYSRELKKHVKKLVYIPYFVTAGYEPPEHRYYMPVYEHADYIIVQSEKEKNYYKEYFYYGKMLALGSPKLDRVIRICQEGGVIPEEWQEVLGNKKVIMINTTINSLLKYNEEVFHTLQQIFHEVDSSKIALIWRPHPLLESTLRTMRPHLLEQYEALQKEFQDLNIGVIDQSADLNNVIAISHAYIGCGGSSVVNLFRVAQKPIYLLTYKEEIARRKELSIRHMEKIGDRYYFTSGRYNAIFSVDKDFHEVIYENSIPDVSVFDNSISGQFLIEENIMHIAPMKTNNTYQYNTKTKKVTEIFQHDSSYGCFGICNYGEEMFYLPQQSDAICVYHKKLKKVEKYRDCIEAFKPSDQEWNIGGIGRYVVLDGILYASYTEVNSILEFDLCTKEYKVHTVGISGCTAIVVDGETLWLSSAKDGVLVQWNTITHKEVRKYNMPPELNIWKSPNGSYLAHRFIFLSGEYLLTLPAYSNAMVRCNICTGVTEVLWNDIFGTIDKEVLGGISCLYAKQLSEDMIFIQREDYKCFLYSIRENIFQDVTVELPESIIELWKQKLVKGINGEIEVLELEKAKRNGWFTEIEFINICLTKDVSGLEKKESIETLLKSMHDTCGKVVHEWMMKVIIKA
ncbi:MAG: hypothetical protein R3Y54_06555 [Eubacteriales bacterium]